ncbi:hypothetical protein INR49_013696 [Caranx melampygus]|nr:hypothetical protein INR49_013696 [Caranx melampygus]
MEAAHVLRFLGHCCLCPEALPSPLCPEAAAAAAAAAAVPPCAAFSRFDLDAALSGPVLLVLVDPKEMLDCRVLNTFSVLLLSVLEKEEVAVTGVAVPEPWKVRRMLHPPSAAAVLGLFRGTLSSNVAAILSSFLKCFASRELKMGEVSLRLLFVVVCVCMGPVAFTERRVRMMEPFWAM